ncbi:MAG: GNAT family N-acetyltransferase [Hyphomicrobiales bacterium]|nr:GNAT family N-acetyltransferase [Hyphomicrobiales bacterium]
MNLYYESTTHGLDADALRVLWQARPRLGASPEALVAQLEASSAVELAIDPAMSVVVGLLAAERQGEAVVHLTLFGVHPDVHKQGVGTRLMRRMLHRFEAADRIAVFCEPSLAHFYSWFGFEAAFAMVKRGRGSPAPGGGHARSLDEDLQRLLPPDVADATAAAPFRLAS